MLLKKLSLLLMGCFIMLAKTQASPSICTPAFIAPDTVCVNQAIQIINPNTCAATSNYWSFCSGNLRDDPTALNIGNPGGFAYAPVFMSLVSDNNVKYGFMVDHVGASSTKGRIIRYKFGTSYLNTPVGTDIGDFGISSFSKVEELVIKQDAGNWYGFVCTAGGYLYRLDFGTSLENMPTYHNFGYFGSLYGINVLQEDGNWFLLTSNPNSNSMLRFTFGNTLSNNNPNTTYLGNINGAFDAPGNITSVLDDGNWYTFVSCRGNSTFARVNWGNSLNNTPTANNLGNIGNLDMPRGFRILKDCGTYFGYLTNEGSNTITRLEFTNGINYPPVGTNIGSIGGINFPHSISDIFRQGDNVYMFIPNVTGNSLTRLLFKNCTSSSVASSTLVTPPAFSYNQVGTYNVSLTINEGLIDQNTYCRQIVVVNPIGKPDAIANVPCTGDTLKLRVNNIDATAQYVWTGPNGFITHGANVDIPNATVSGTYILSAVGHCNTLKDTVYVSLRNISLNLGRDTSICVNSPIILNATTANATYLWNTGASQPRITATTAGTYYVRVVANGCTARDTIVISSLRQASPFDLGRDTNYCGNFSRVLSTGDASTKWSDGTTGKSITVNRPGTYIATITNACGPISDTITLKQDNGSIELGNDTTICEGAQLTLDASNIHSTYLWSTGATTATLPVTTAGNYSVQVTTSTGCILNDAINISLQQKPKPFFLGNDTSYCQDFLRVLTTGDASTVWSTGATGASIFVNQAGTYIATSSNVCGTETGKITLQQFTIPVVDLGPDTALCENAIELKSGATTGTVLWSTGDNASTISINEKGTYWVTVTDNHHCKNSDTIVVKSNCVYDVYFPGAFSPNGDQVNDIFMPLSNRQNMTINKFTIFDRWGSEVYKAENFNVADASNGWNGTFNGEQSPQGVYVYIVEMTSVVNDQPQTKTYKGTVTLLR